MKRSLTDEQVQEARKLYFEVGLTQREIAQNFNCSIVTISLWVDPNEERRTKKFGRQERREIPIEQEKFDKVKALKEKGYTSYDIHLITKMKLEEVNRYYAQLPVNLNDVYSFD